MDSSRASVYKRYRDNQGDWGGETQSGLWFQQLSPFDHHLESAIYKVIWFHFKANKLDYIYVFGVNLTRNNKVMDILDLNRTHVEPRFAYE